ncbi:MAG: bifunctional DNA-formamidopyrimidine glycosylase/DNA-(apurinic or apyrimidinic site) lyase [Thermomicrobiales bacterium]
MPELPEVETVRQSLLGRVVGQQIADMRVGDFPGVLGTDSPEDVLQRVRGRRFQDIRRRAKYLFFDLDDDTAIMIHLRMTGRLSLVPTGRAELRHQRAAFTLGNGHDLRFSDQRKFGRVLHLHPDDVARLDARIGIEPLSDAFTPGWLQEKLRRRSGKIKAVILDQHLIGGLGNIYADEALFAARIHPERAANSLDQDELTRLQHAIQRVLLAALDRKGTTFSSFEDADGLAGGYGEKLQVYGRGGRAACPECGTPLLRLVVGGRGTAYCPACQPLNPVSSTEAKN